MKKFLKPHPKKSQYRFIDTVIEGVASGSWHVITSFCKTEDEAIRLCRITWPNEKMWNIYVPEVGMLKTITCSCCGKREHIYYGTGAAQVSMSEVVKAAKIIGWSVCPKVKCITCKSE